MAAGVQKGISMSGNRFRWDNLRDRHSPLLLHRLCIIACQRVQSCFRYFKIWKSVLFLSTPVNVYETLVGYNGPDLETYSKTCY